jgi:hypothetical protein
VSNDQGPTLLKSIHLSYAFSKHVRTTHSLQNIFLFFVFGDIFVCTISLILEHFIYSTCNNIISKIGCVIAERVSNKIVVGEKIICGAWDARKEDK